MFEQRSKVLEGRLLLQTHQTMAPTTFSNDDCSRSSSDESIYDIDMTEEEAMAIWLERNEKIGERVRRREAEALRRAEQQPLSREVSSSSSRGGAAVDSDRSLHSSDINSGIQHAAAVTHSDAWNRAISRNVMGEYDPHNTDPAYQNAYHAYQKFVVMNQPGVADSFIASTPGLAALMEERSHLMARERHLDLQTNQMQRQMQSSPIISSSSCHHDSCDARQSSSAAPALQDQGGGSITNPPLHRTTCSPDEVVKKQGEFFTITKVPVPSSPKQSNEKVSETPFYNSPAASAQILEYKRLQEAHSQTKSEDNTPKRTSSSTFQQPNYFYGFSNRTQYYSREVTCLYCQSRVYTAPLAVHMFCQSCAQISKLEVEDIESRWEGKMQELEDMDIGY